MRRHEARAVVVMERFGVDGALIGDLVEQHRAGRPALWLWRQTVMAVAARVAATVRSDPTIVGVSAVVGAAALALPYVWMHFLWHYVVMLDTAWYPRSITWLARSSPVGLWQVLVFLHPWTWTYTAGWCAMLGAVTWCLVRLWPKYGHLVVVVFVLSNVSQSLPSLGKSFLDWSHEPANPIGISSAVSYAFFVFVATPLSIYVGGRTGRPAKSYVDASTH
jgi:hypothetical protein